MWEIGRAFHVERCFRSIRKSLEDYEPDLRFQWFYRLGECARDELGDVDEAIACFLKSAGIEPNNLASLRALDTLYAQANNWDDQVQTKEKLLELVTDPAERADCFMPVFYDEMPDKIELLAKLAAALNGAAFHLLAERLRIVSPGRTRLP